MYIQRTIVFSKLLSFFGEEIQKKQKTNVKGKKFMENKESD